MKTTKLNKSQTIEVLNENNISTSNLKTFINRNKRLNLNYDKCHKWLKDQEEKQQEQTTKQHTKEQAHKFNMSVKEYKELSNKAYHILDDFHTGHSMGCYRILRLNGKVFTTNHALQEYANSCKWNEVYGTITIDMNKKQLKNIEKDANFRWVVDGKVLVESGIKQYHNVYFEKI